MAFEDVIFNPIPNILQGLPGAVQAGFDIAAKRHQIEQQQKSIELEQQKIALSFSEKAMDLLPKMKGLQPKEKKFFLSAFAGFSEKAGYKIPQEMLDYMDASPDAIPLTADLVKSIRELHPGDPVLQAAAFQDSVTALGGNLTDFKPVIDAMTAENLAGSQRLRDQEQERIKELNDLRTIKSKSTAGSDFRTRADSLPTPSAQAAAYNGYESITKDADELRKTLTNKDAIKYAPPKEIEAARRLLVEIDGAKQDPQKHDKARQALDRLKLSLVDIGVTAATKEQTEAEKKAKVETEKVIAPLVKEFKDTYKPQRMTIDTASRVITLLNNPKIRDSSVVWGAVGTLLAKYFDPTTGVKEAEQARVIKSVQGSTIKQWQEAFFSFFQGRELSAEQRNLIGELVNSELADVRSVQEDAKARIAERALPIGADPNVIFRSVFAREVPEYRFDSKRLTGNNPHSVNKDGTVSVSGDSQQGFLDKFLGRILPAKKPESGTPAVAGPSPAPSAAPSPKASASPSAKAAPKPSPSPGSGRSGLQKLFLNIMPKKLNPKEELKNGANWVDVPGMPGVKELR